MRTEHEILKDFEKLGYFIFCNNDLRIRLENKGDILMISKVSRWYSCKTPSDKDYEYLSVPINMQEHKLLNELFTIWGWL